eukprot:7901647-Pyramimonas_sp.AAC.1
MGERCLNRCQRMDSRAARCAIRISLLSIVRVSHRPRKQWGDTRPWAGGANRRPGAPGQAHQTA